MISAIILAAGEARRMQNSSGKQLLPLGQSTILGKTIESVLASKAGETLVVLGYNAASIGAAIAGYPLKIVLNQNYPEGLSSSIIAGIKAAAPRSEGYLLVLGDQPFIASQVIDRLIEMFSAAPAGIVIPVYRGRRGHPVLIPRKYQNELLELKGDAGAKSVVSRHAQDIAEVEVDSPWVLMDIDTPQDYLKLRPEF